MPGRSIKTPTQVAQADPDPRQLAGVDVSPGVSRAILFQVLRCAHPGRTKAWCLRRAGYAPTTKAADVERTLEGEACKLADDQLRDFLKRHPMFSAIGVLSRLAGIATATDTTYEVDDDGRRHRVVEYREPAQVRIAAEREIIKVAGHEAPKQMLARVEAKVSGLFVELSGLTADQLEALAL